MNAVDVLTPSIVVRATPTDRVQRESGIARAEAEHRNGCEQAISIHKRHSSAQRLKLTGANRRRESIALAILQRAGSRQVQRRVGGHVTGVRKAHTRNRARVRLEDRTAHNERSPTKGVSSRSVDTKFGTLQAGIDVRLRRMG